MNHYVFIAAAALASLSLNTSAAVAPRAGLWSVELLLAQMPELDPELLEQFGFGGLEVPKPAPQRHQICLTQEQVSQNRFLDLQDESSGCVATNLRRNGDVLNGDLACNGWLQGRGQVQIQLLDAQRYSGTTSFQGNTQEGIPLYTNGTLNGRWLSADCGAVAPLGN